MLNSVLTPPPSVAETPVRPSPAPHEVTGVTASRWPEIIFMSSAPRLSADVSIPCREGIVPTHPHGTGVFLGSKKFRRWGKTGPATDG